MGNVRKSNLLFLKTMLSIYISELVPKEERNFWQILQASRAPVLTAVQPSPLTKEKDKN